MSAIDDLKRVRVDLEKISADIISDERVLKDSKKALQLIFDKRSITIGYAKMKLGVNRKALSKTKDKVNSLLGEASDLLVEMREELDKTYE